MRNPSAAVPVQPALPVVPEFEFADRLRKARTTYAQLTDTRITQRQFAELIGVPGKAYENWESGYNRPEDIVAVSESIQAATNIPASWLLTGRYEGEAVRISRETLAPGGEPFSGSDIDEFLDAQIPRQATPAA